MVKKDSVPDKGQAYKEAFVSALSQHLATPSESWPSVRCWAKDSLLKVIKQVRDELAIQGHGSSQSHSSLLDWMCKIRLMAKLPIEGASIYLFEAGATTESEVDPLELLMASVPAGVICYMSAIVYHGLTTQHAGHHHIAKLVPTKPTQEIEQAEVLPSETPNLSPASGDRKSRGLGTQLFQFHQVSYYRTDKTIKLVPGVQTRSYGPRTNIRITTVEQTLLDSLYKPFHCGGPEVVFEAWQEAIQSDRIDEGRIVSYLHTMQYPATTRRLAVMLEQYGYSPRTELSKFFESALNAIDRNGPYARISLLPGVNYTTLNDEWLVHTP